MLVISMLCQTVAGTAFARIHVAAAKQMGGSQQAAGAPKMDESPMLLGGTFLGRGQTKQSMVILDDVT